MAALTGANSKFVMWWQRLCKHTKKPTRRSKNCHKGTRPCLWIKRQGDVGRHRHMNTNHPFLPTCCQHTPVLPAPQPF